MKNGYRSKRKRERERIERTAGMRQISVVTRVMGGKRLNRRFEGVKERAGGKL